MTKQLGMLPPQEVDLEETILGAIMLEKGSLEKVMDFVQPNTFYKDCNRYVYEAILKLYDTSNPIDIRTVIHQLRKDGNLEAVGGAYFITSLTQKVNSGTNIETHARIIAEMAIKRHIISISADLQSGAYDDSTDALDLLTKAENDLKSINLDSGKPFVCLGDTKVIMDVIEEVSEARKNYSTGNSVGVPTTFPSLDKYSGGFHKTDLIIIAARPAMGKGLLLNEVVMSPSGPVMIGDLVVGDKLCSTYGDSCNVVGVFPQGKRPVYEIKFNDGLVVIADDQHLWEVQDRKIRKSKSDQVRVLSTKQLLSEGLYIKERRNFSVKYCSPAYHHNINVPIDPYILGLLIGDCYMSPKKISFSNPESDLSKAVIDYFGPANVTKEGIEHLIKNGSNIKEHLSSLNLLGKLSYDKFIPYDYLFNSIENRIKLLQGLIDTDGHIVDSNQIEFSTTSFQLKNDITTLVRGLGGRASFIEKIGRYKKDGVVTTTRTYYRVFISFSSDSYVVPVASVKHLAKYNNNKKYHKRFIESIKYAGESETVCIKVDSKDECFLMNDYLVTHNTGLAVTIAKNLALQFKVPIGFFSLEMSWKQLMIRIMSQETQISSEVFRNGKIDDYEFNTMFNKVDGLKDMQIYVDDNPSLTIRDIRMKSMKMVQLGAKIIMVDYLQLITGSKKGQSREQEISEISRQLKVIAKELDVPVIALSQLSRSVETRGGDKRPILSDLRESGSIEQDADIVMFLYRPEYYGITESNGMSLAGLCEIIYAKNRHGRIGSEYLKFVNKFTKFVDLDMPEEKAKEETLF